MSDHAYTILGAVEVEVEDTAGGKRERLLKLRNPWGHQEWTGEWSDQSSKWTKEIRERVKHKG